ncbi:VOC family protein [Salinibacterium sp. M195]|uniref:VOC family protein n=1 Tax=Salinibacterium sp. M195 TaxID=2583374 RepID=UPI001C6259E9|nr:VOC family protein [Salinibacterium sp. M195]QYH36788.1 VOC family protein [Salinibacterium sp. M195]
MKSNPYLSFRDNAREALAYYQEVFGGTTEIHTFADFQASQDPEEQEWIMHGQLESPAGITLMMSDTPKSMEYTPGGSMSISIGGYLSEKAAMESYWQKLSDGGRIDMPLEPAEWGGIFGMVVDRYSVTWIISISDDNETR